MDVRDDALMVALQDMLGEDVPRVVSPPWVRDTFGVSIATVYRFINDGTLPAERLEAANGTTAGWKFKPTDALLIWGRHLVKRMNAKEGDAVTV